MNGRTEAVTVRFTLDEKKALVDAANKSGLNPASYVRYIVLKTIKKEEQSNGW